MTSKNKNKNMKVITVDYERCTGCRLCELVCSVKHVGVSNPARSRVRVIKWESEGFYLPMLCQQCERAACMEVCPKDALYRNLNRIVIDYDLCIGCKMCVMACPFGGMGIDPDGKMIKCDLCDGEPQCVRFCEPKAIDYVDATSASLQKKRFAGKRLSVMWRFVGY
jgi:Fe-S-cluster-containing hydrogenase component 2